MQGKVISEALGWEGESIRDENEAYDIYRELKRNRDNQTPPFTFTLRERNEQREQVIIQEQQKEKAAKAKATPFDEIITKRYLPFIVGNRRNRSLSEAEGEHLLNVLKKHSLDVHDMCLLSLQAGLRFGEIAGLKWNDVDIIAGQGHLKDTKSNKNRPFFLTSPVKAMFARRKLQGVAPEELVFPDKNGNEQQKISKTFQLVVGDLFNQGIEDRRERVVFHTLRRTFATQLLNQGTSIYHIQKLFGHADITTTTDTSTPIPAP